MNSVKFFCPSCRQKLEAEEEMFGTKLQCPVCNAWMMVPNGPAQASPAKEPTQREAKPRYLLALGTGAALGLALMAALWFLWIKPPKQVDLSKLPMWSPQVASSVLESASATNAASAKSPPDNAAPPTNAPVPAPPTEASRKETVEDGKTEAPSAKPPPEEKPKAVEEPPQRPARVLSDDEKRKIFTKLMEADDKAHQEARRRMPDDPTHGMVAGDSLRLKEATPVYRAAPPADAPQAELEPAGKLHAGCTIKVMEVRVGRSLPWYHVEATDKSGRATGKGWISATSLTGQSGADMTARHIKQQQLRADILAQYQRAIEAEHSIPAAQAGKILSEGIENGWDGSKRGDITGD